jgi:hypothetical protein
VTGARPIETNYGGCRFRSRLEARWAVFFDAVGVKWEYEVEGYETPDGRYLPDFRLRLHNRHVLFEIKPDHGPTAPRTIPEPDPRWRHVAAISEFYVAYGLPAISRINPEPELFGVDGFPNSLINPGFVRIEADNEACGYQFFCECPKCWAIDIQQWGLMVSEDESTRKRDDPMGIGSEWRFNCCGELINRGCRGYLGGVKKVAGAYDDARMARFEFGESGR